ncbi:hypothetical protein, partial [Streptomyces sp. NPDC090029]|uniref:hypothetical protein n=1 Tax=Streptomyces sp. NPDC090029 TaxID=3365924 RepID=UPI0037F8F73F
MDDELDLDSTLQRIGERIEGIKEGQGRHEETLDVFREQGCFKVPAVAESCRSRWCDACWPSRLVRNEA